MTDMTQKIFESTAYGRAALAKFYDGKEPPENFRIFEAGLAQENPTLSDGTMRVSGAEFKTDKRGPNTGKLAVMIKGTERMVYVTRGEILAMKCE
jgi:hypothetical protein